MFGELWDLLVKLELGASDMLGVAGSGLGNCLGGLSMFRMGIDNPIRPNK